MSEIAVAVHNLSKIYRLYTKPLYRFLDIFGWLKTPNAYSEHAALASINLDIRKGEKVAIIGRNGAGKSTLLKLICGAIEPTSGQIHINGKIHALLQIGTGFHPDFTGRENVYSYLANLGLSGRKADEKVREIIEFSELEEYIDQPMKTYSTGMGVRIMFATSTAISPDILVLDEVLGVGDGYFVQKSYQRIRSLCENDGTTLIFVTHDLYSAANICDRSIWIDRGGIVIDSDSKFVIKAYEQSIREQEEIRLRKKKQQKIKTLISTFPNSDDPKSVAIVEIREKAIGKDVDMSILSNITLCTDDDKVTCQVADNAIPGERACGVIFDNCCWGDVCSIEGKDGRKIVPFGSPFHKVAVYFLISSIGNYKNIKVEIDCFLELDTSFEVVLFMQDKQYNLGELISSSRGWCNNKFMCDCNEGALVRVNCVKEGGVRSKEGSSDIDIHDVKLLNGFDKESFVFVHGETMKVLIYYKIRKTSIHENAQVIVVFHKNGIVDVARYFTKELVFDYSSGKEGTVSLTIPKIMLGDGKYTVSVVITKEGYWDKKQILFYSINPDVYVSLPKLFEIQVVQGGILGEGTIMVCDGVWDNLITEPLKSVIN